MPVKENLNHSKRYCKCPVIWISKNRKKKWFARLWLESGGILHELARREDCRMEEGHYLEGHWLEEYVRDCERGMALRLLFGCLSDTVFFE